MRLQQNFIVGRKNITRKYYYDTRKDFYVKDNYLDEILIFKEKPLKKSGNCTQKQRNYLISFVKKLQLVLEEEITQLGIRQKFQFLLAHGS